MSATPSLPLFRVEIDAHDAEHGPVDAQVVEIRAADSDWARTLALARIGLTSQSLEHTKAQRV
jgi:hypothetical protein